ncbi:MAG: UDP-glucose/GDP-mannose dehydrogenase family protein [Azospirillaceae bacterium]
MKIAIIGTGYVGLVSGACFAEFGTDVVCVDKDARKIERLKAGEIPIYEPGLDAMVLRNSAAGRLTFTTELAGAIDGAAAVFIAVGTPSRRGDGHADLTYVFGAAAEVADALGHETVIVTKSTVPVGTGRRILEIVRERRPDLDISVASNPEFLREGSAITDFMTPDRVVIGTQDEKAEEVLRALYRPLYLIETPIVVTGLETAELTKYAANAFLAVKITFINEIADLCEKVGGDIHDVARAMGLDKRIGAKFLHPGPGYGGSCFPKDTRALVATADEYASPQRIVSEVVAINDARKVAMVDRVVAACNGSVDGLTIGVLGLAFKQNTDDMREAPSLDIIPRLQQQGATIKAFDPAAMGEAKHLLSDIAYCEDAYAAMEDVDCLVVLTEWNQFRAIAPSRIAKMMRGRVVVDLRNVYDPQEMAAAGLTYHSVGRPAVSGAKQTLLKAAGA